MTIELASQVAPLERGREPALSSQPGIPDPLDRAMDRYAEGDDAVFEELARGLMPRLRAFVLRLSGSHELADDLTQETFCLSTVHAARSLVVPQSCPGRTPSVAIAS